MIPTRQQAEAVLVEALPHNPGPWERHSRLVAHCARRIATACPDGELDPETAWVLGLLHDIGRRFGKGHLRHVYDGWQYMLSLGWAENAQICLTHSFNRQTLEDYVGNNDLTAAEYAALEQALARAEYTDYDRLIQLCDCLAGGEGILDMEERMADVRRRYGSYPQEKWDQNLALKAAFERRAGRDLYDIVKEGLENEGMGPAL